MTSKKEFDVLRKSADEMAGFVTAKKGGCKYPLYNKDRGRTPRFDECKSAKLSSLAANISVMLKKPVSITAELLIPKRMKPCQTGVLQTMSL